jgi:hypothetical protein
VPPEVAGRTSGFEFLQGLLDASHPAPPFSEVAEAPSEMPQIVVPAVDADTAVELSFWESVRVSDNPDMYEAYLEKYPNGEFVPLAKVRLEELHQ